MRFVPYLMRCSFTSRTSRTIWQGSLHNKALSRLVMEWIYFISLKSTTLPQLKPITPIFKALFYDSHKPYQLNDFNHSLYDVSTGHAWRSFKANGLVCLKLYCVNLFVVVKFCSLQVCSSRVKKVTESLSSPFLNTFVAKPAGTFPVSDLPQFP